MKSFTDTPRPRPAQSAKQPRPLNAFNPAFPKSVARRKDVDAPLLVMLAARSFTGYRSDWVTREAAVSKVVSGGLGKNVARRCIARARALGYLERRQGPRGAGGAWGKAVEVLKLGKPKGREAMVIWQRWFDGSLHVNELAALLYLRAGHGRGRAYASEVAERFGWAESTTLKYVRCLMERELVERRQERDSETGNFKGTTYFVPSLSWETTRQKPGNRLPGNRPAGNIEGLRPIPGKSPASPDDGAVSQPEYAAARQHSPLMSSTKVKAQNQGERWRANTPKKQTTFATNTQGQAPEWHGNPSFSLEELEAMAFEDDNLLGWIDGERSFEFSNVKFPEPGNEEVADVVAAYSDVALENMLLRATGGRVHKRIRGPAGLYAIRYIAASMRVDVADEDAFGPADAIDEVMHQIEIRIGSRKGAWLNSIKVIGVRITHAQGHGDAFKRRGSRHKVA
ncbi:MAG: hypothetical protein NW223_04570 [Hyphomicrobiaceae bacterium]|nr:hypothetical protein [Hyphomicrobiaceae bacterium]